MTIRLAAILFVVILTIAGAVIYFFPQKPGLILGTKIVSSMAAPDLSASLIGELNKAGIALDSSPLITGDTLSASISGWRVLFTKEGNFATQVRALQLILPHLTMETGMRKEIDLRFTKVIIR